ncbi:MAG: TOBE domain-containing protein [Gammaproteobacteria bacterium]|jgi:molybdate transport system regulatory protein
MNRLPGVVTAIQSAGQVALADVEVRGGAMSALLMESDAEAGRLKPGAPVLVLFQEAEVSLAKHLAGLISLRNRLGTRIKQVDKGGVLTRVALDYHGHEIVSIITTRSAERLQLAAGDEVEALIKANEVTLVAREASS